MSAVQCRRENGCALQCRREYRRCKRVYVRCNAGGARKTVCGETAWGLRTSDVPFGPDEGGALKNGWKSKENEGFVKL